jgi:hypothetical protein
VALVNSPPDFELPLEAATLHTPDAAPHSLDVVLAFFTRRADFEPAFAQLARRLQPAGGLWIAWPKKSSGVATDLNENVIREIGVAAGLVDNKVCAVTDVWSGLRFVYRLKDRPKQ